MTEILDWVALLLAISASTSLLLSRDWRWSIGLLAAQYLAVFWFLQSPWPVSMAAAKLVTGWMSATVLGIALSESTSPVDEQSPASWPENRLFRLFAAGLILFVTLALARSAVDWLGLNLPVAWGGLVLLGMGILTLGITDQPFRVILGLLTMLSGFEVLYAAVESSSLVAAFLSAITLGLSLAGAYFQPSSEEEQAE